MYPDQLRLDHAWAAELTEFLRRQLDSAPDHDEDDPVGAVLTAGYLRDLGLLGAVTGMAPEEVRDLWRQSVLLTTVPFRMRPGTDEDQSLANSRRGLEGMELGLAAGALDVVRDLAKLVQDPPGASYLGEGSVVCTTEEQLLAYATRDLVLGREGPGRWLARIGAPTGAHALRTALLVALARANAADARWLCEEIHREYLQRIAGEAILRRLDDCVDVPSLAALVLARQVGLDLTPDQADPWLPLVVPGLSTRSEGVER
ncbi:hypothetical protein ABIC21_000538 [Pseudarthrobacter sp. PvP090]